MGYRNFDMDRLERQIADARRYEDLARKSVAPTTAQERSLKQATEAYRKQLRQLGSLPAVEQKRVYSVLAPAQEAIKRNLRNLAAALKPKLSLPFSLPRVPLIPRLPNLSQMVDMQGLLQKAIEAAQRAAEATAEGDDTLEASGFGFADHLWNWGFVASFAHIDPRVRDAVVTNRLAAETRSEEFEGWLEEEMTGSAVLAHRWEAMRQALAAHRRREYMLSIPVLLAQVEGIVGDALVLKNLAAAEGHKLYRLGTDGVIELNKKEKPIELRAVPSSWSTPTSTTKPRWTTRCLSSPTPSSRGATGSCTAATRPTAKRSCPSKRCSWCSSWLQRSAPSRREGRPAPQRHTECCHGLLTPKTESFHRRVYHYGVIRASEKRRPKRPMAAVWMWGRTWV